MCLVKGVFYNRKDVLMGLRNLHTLSMVIIPDEGAFQEEILCEICESSIRVDSEKVGLAGNEFQENNLVTQLGLCHLMGSDRIRTTDQQENADSFMVYPLGTSVSCRQDAGVP